VTFKDLKKRVSATHEVQQQTKLFERMRDKSFWIWDTRQHKQVDIETNGDCCFNHIIGLPTKDGVEKPLFDYERKIFDALKSQKYIWIKKATGLGITEYFLRYIGWLCLRNDDYRNSQICIVTGPNIDMAIRLIKRLKALFETKHNIIFSNKETVLELNGCTIEAFPSNHLDSYRALDNPKFILLDEADFFRKGEQEDVRHVSERYIAKSNPYIIMISTPNAPGGLFDTMEREPENTCMYKRIHLDYTCGLDKIYTEKEIEKAKQSPAFPREYQLAYGYGIGNVFLPDHIDRAIELGAEQIKYFSKDYNPSSSRALSIDPGFGSSKFAMVITELINGMIVVVYAKAFEKPDYQEAIDVAFNLMREYKINKVFVDGSNRAVWTTLKNTIGESIHDNDEIYESDMIVPVSFGIEHKRMLSDLQLLFSNQMVAVPPQFEDLILDLRIARTSAEGKVEKTASAQLDLFDCMRLCTKHYRFE
jgi:hypothetical protein